MWNSWQSHRHLGWNNLPFGDGVPFGLPHHIRLKCHWSPMNMQVWMITSLELQHTQIYKSHTQVKSLKPYQSYTKVIPFHPQHFSIFLRPAPAAWRSPRKPPPHRRSAVWPDGISRKNNVTWDLLQPTELWYDFDLGYDYDYDLDEYFDYDLD